MKRTLAIIALLAVAAQAQDTKEAKVRELMKLTGAADLGKQTMDSMLHEFRKMPGLPPGFLEKFRQTARPEELIERIVPIYMKHLDDETLDAAIAFYKTPAGRKLTRAQPAILQESFQVGKEWGQELAMKVMRDIQAGPARDVKAAKVEDLNDMRDLVGLLVVGGKMPIKDGRLDVYALVRKGDITQEHFALFRSSRFEKGPSVEEIEKGDYANFPYERFKGEVKLGALVPLLWDKEPDRNNGRVVGFSSGAAKYLPEDEVQALLEKHGQLPAAPKPER